MKKFKIFFTVAALLLTGAGAFAQTMLVKGTVVDASTGEPVPYAAIQIQGTMKGTTTDVNGEYSISVDAKGVLVFSSIGYISKDVPVAGRAQVDCALAVDENLLDETIVVAYGTATKSSFTGSAAVVKSDDIQKKIVSNVTNALAGSTPGVQIIGASGDPAGNGGAIRIRGIGSMSASNSPLIVVDGVPYEGSISDINPTDVESMSVLKDAAASAIYGHRGANGVVIITTKKGVKGDAQVTFDARLGSNSRLIPNYDVITNPAEYYETHYKMMYNSYLYAGHTSEESYAFADKNLFDQNNGGLGYQVYTVPEGQKLIGTNFKLNPNATLGYCDGEYTYLPDDWYKEAYHNSIRQEYNVAVNGSSDRFNYYASAGYLDDKGMVSNSEYVRYTTRINADYQAKEWIKVLTNMNYSHSFSQSASYSDTFGSSGNIFYIVNNMGPIYPLYVRDAKGNIMTGANGKPLYDANQTNFTRPNFVGNAVRDNEYDSASQYADVLTGKWGLVLTPVKGLTLSGNVGVTYDGTRYNSLGTIYGSSSSTDGYAYVSFSRMFAVNKQFLAEYKTDFGGSLGNLDVLAGYEEYSNMSQSFYGSNDHLFNPTVGELSNADGQANKIVKSYTNRYMSKGFLSRVQYDLAGKYFISGSYRRDASSRFAKGHQWGNFGSAGAAWLISKEDFLTSSKVVNMLKLKVSYGIQGNDNLNALYPYADQYTHTYNPDTKEYSLVLNYKGNEDLTWESSHSFNAGADFDLFNNYLSGTVEWFSRTTTDLLYSKDVPLSAGNPTGKIPVNIGSIRNNGWEVTLNGDIIRTRNVQ